MERTELETQYRLERDICAGANASDYHKKRFAELSKEMGIANSTPKTVEAKTETVQITESNTSTQETTVVEMDEAPDEEPKKKQG
jgi:diphthamide synthase (EF-2-diphthine--ammonia ligase)